MRIVSGKHKGRRIMAPKKLPVRPTTDMAKEALFNILNNRFYFDELTVLDLFTGTGNISYEFASRGTTAITAVDSDAGCVAFVARIAREMAMEITPIKSDVFTYLKKVPSKSDIIFADPPYGISFESFASIPSLVFEKELLHENGVLVVEHSVQTDLSSLPYFNNQRKYGSSLFSFFEQENAN
ncbi:methyltransferase [Aggregatimonas sangjinii]|uniref:Methyltransferase n=1 Tax=Aggregatimonas sangjinii TaxID=2583587 RepID=A0A5B7SLF0_9FLAO|nr:RsmD family RNA methyltransferase [Aggregatimonas sangjinii]QCW99394.1 methyltransferase [Aggregatimonas sangjinii]